jgi:hypothetical protein
VIPQMNHITVLTCDMSERGLLVAFSDGSTFLFPKGFLVESRIVYAQLVSKNDEVLQPTNDS